MAPKRINIKNKKYIKPLTDVDFIRVEFSTVKGKVVKFCLQYDALINNRIRTIMRMDNAHGDPPHKHTFHKLKKQTKTFINQDPNVAFKEGQKYLVGNFKKIKENFLFSS